MIPDLMTTPEAAEKLGWSLPQLNKLLREGELGHDLPARYVAEKRVWSITDLELLGKRLLEYVRRSKPFYQIAERIAQKSGEAELRGTADSPSLTAQSLADELDVPVSAIKEWNNRRAQRLYGFRLRHVTKDKRNLLFTWRRVYDWSRTVVDWLDEEYVPLRRLANAFQPKIVGHPAGSENWTLVQWEDYRNRIDARIEQIKAQTAPEQLK